MDCVLRTEDGAQGGAVQRGRQAFICLAAAVWKIWEGL